MARKDAGRTSRGILSRMLSRRRMVRGSASTEDDVVDVEAEATECISCDEFSVFSLKSGAAAYPESTLPLSFCTSVAIARDGLADCWWESVGARGGC
jgi:hypothetical protein